ncbi:WXG100 family type VII secretion target [Gordonia sp. SID5947]|uniref:WXG100 family type VII secretion target n=1 Tax=Gordonia sp. SID5947 TaxID=2690315 RepID=UPI00136DC512|nr:WXG100 family type VII secretion target [Gordonia sp. SID5947]MYR07563.1 WXG100 family type VII secretion target [Gordonia sp. SID5947]
MMKYNFGEINALADALQQNGHNLISQTETLESAVKQLSGTFTGGSYEAYQAKMASWKSEMSDTQQILAKIANAVREGGQHMHQTDQAGANAIGG